MSGQPSKSSTPCFIMKNKNKQLSESKSAENLSKKSSTDRSEKKRIEKLKNLKRDACMRSCKKSMSSFSGKER
jgi:hypothetical protein